MTYPDLFGRDSVTYTWNRLFDCCASFKTCKTTLDLEWVNIVWKEMFSTISCIYIETHNRIAQENLRFFLRKLLRFSYCAISYELLCLFGNFLPRVLNLIQEHISSFYQNPLTILDILQWGIKEDKNESMRRFFVYNE